MSSMTKTAKPNARLREVGLGCLLAITLSGCMTVGPNYQEPELAISQQWQTTVPRDTKEISLEHWWEQFNDPSLVVLIQAALADNPSLDKAVASISSARATLASVKSGFAPSLDGSANVQRSRQQQSNVISTQTSRAAGFDASWELDLFGKVRRSAEAAQARLQARVNDWHEARVSLAAEVADTYAQYRACLLLIDAYGEQLVSTEKTAQATEASVQAGLTSRANGSLARAGLASTQSSLQAQRVQRDLLVKSLVALTGMDEARLRDRLGEGGEALPQPTAFRVATVPADVLRQRPDVASLERELAAASASIGAAQADLYPSLSLSGSVSVSASSLASGITSWSFGPALSIPLFDGGKRHAAVASAEADYQGAQAAWRQGVRDAVKEVEQALVNLDGIAYRSERAALAAQEYRAYFEATEVRWRTGGASLLTLEETRRSALSSQIESITLQRDQVRYWVALYKAVGGGWTPTAVE